MPEPGDGVMAGNSRAALPAPISTLAAPFRLGIGPSGSTARLALSAGPLAGGVAKTGADTGAAVTAVVSAAAGGVHVAAVVTVAVAVSFTEVTEVAVAATAMPASKLTACLSVTEAMAHEAVPSPLAQPLLNVAGTLDGWAVSLTVTPEADPFLAEICTT